MDEKIKEQIMDIRDSGLTNMFDLPMVQRLAFDRNYYELVLLIEDHREEYLHFILTVMSDNHSKSGTSLCRLYVYSPCYSSGAE